MQLRNSNDRYGWLSQLFHWTTALAVVAAYVVIYHVLWFVPDETALRLPKLNIHWALGFSVGLMTLARLVWRSRQIRPTDVPGSRLEHLLARVAHALLYVFLLLMPLTGYLGTRRGIDFGLFYVPSFKDTALFEWVSATWGVTFAEFEVPLDAVHHFAGKWLVWSIVSLHIAAALFHHWVRHDNTLLRMLPRRMKISEADQPRSPARESA